MRESFGVGPRMQQMLEDAKKETEHHEGLDAMFLRPGSVIHYRGVPLYLADGVRVLGTWNNVQGDGNVQLEWVRV